MCDRWSGDDGFKNFLGDMEPSHTPGMTIDRLDVNAGYSPENCRWATIQDQQRNPKPSRITHSSEPGPLPKIFWMR